MLRLTGGHFCIFKAAGKGNDLEPLPRGLGDTTIVRHIPGGMIVVSPTPSVQRALAHRDLIAANGPTWPFWILGNVSHSR